jgi:hypothetical protein
MDNRFTDIICEVEGFLSPENQRLQALEKLVYSQMVEEKLDLHLEETALDLYAKIYEDDYEE